jgi:hypothetical protein
MHECAYVQQNGLKQPADEQPKCEYALVCCGVLQSSVCSFFGWVMALWRGRLCDSSAAEQSLGLGCCGKQPGDGQGHCFSSAGLEKDWPYYSEQLGLAAGRLATVSR